jgi:hypothetical protein
MKIPAASLRSRTIVCRLIYIDVGIWNHNQISAIAMIVITISRRACFLILIGHLLWA